jgi:uncharacterized protein YjbI with pentapeptide repeats
MSTRFPSRPDVQQAPKDKQRTRADILRLLEDATSSVRDLMAVEIDLSSDAIQRELQRRYSPRAVAWLRHIFGSNTSVSPPWASDLTQGINFSGRDLTASRFDDSKVWRSNFCRAKLDKAVFRGADLGYSLFTDANLTEADFSSADAAKCSFRGAQLTRSHFDHSTLVGADFSKATIQSVYLSGAVLDKTLLSRAQISGQIGEEIDKCYADAVTAYSALKTNFRSLGLFEDASWAYLGERRMETKSRAPWRQTYVGPWYSRPIAWLGNGLRWLGSCLIGAVAGYGERPVRAFAWIPIIIVLYAILFRASGGLSNSVGRPAGWLADFEDSLASFVTMGVGSLTTREGTAQVLTNVEALTGVSLVALVMFSLGKRITRS